MGFNHIPLGTLSGLLCKMAYLDLFSSMVYRFNYSK